MNETVSTPQRIPSQTGAGRYMMIVAVALLAGFLLLLSLTALPSGQATAASGGANICGSKFNDLNGDGVWDPNETTLPNWQIQLQAAGQFTTTTTDANGNYCFHGLADGDYVIAEIMEPGWVQTFPNPSTGTDGTHIVFIQGGQSRDGINFGNHGGGPRQPGLYGSKFYDRNNNGIWGSQEPGLEDWVLQLTDGNTVWTTTTGFGGHYFFTGLVTGTYTLTEVSQPGYTQTFPISPSHYVVSFVPTQAIENLDFGNYAPPVEIHGHKFNDLDGDGLQDAGELGLPNWTINAQGNGLHFTELTDANGDYAFLGLPPGEYIVYESQPAPYWNGQYMVQWTQTAPASGTYTPTLTPGQVLTGTTFGNWVSGQPDFCMIPWDNHFLDQISLETEIYIFNASATGVETFTLQLVGPSLMTITTPMPVVLGAFQYAVIDVEIAYPAIFTGPSQNAQFQAIVTNQATNTTFNCHAALWSYSPNWWTSPNVHSGLGGGVPMGFTQSISFTVTSPGTRLPNTVAATADYRIWAMSRGFTDTSVVSLNGLAPGAIITGQISLEPGEEIDIPLTVKFTDFNLLAPTDVILELDIDGDEIPDIVTSYLIFLEWPHIFLPAVTRP